MRAELEGLSSQELHDLAVRVARHKADVGFFWRLVKAIPAAEAASGHLERTEADLASAAQHITDALRGGEPGLAEALRPLYVDYLEEHGEDATRLRREA
ncbi:hypothetical protein BH18ACT15_BH18ACT15_08830 [soil metagenome]